LETQGLYFYVAEHIPFLLIAQHEELLNLETGAHGVLSPLRYESGKAERRPYK